MTKPDHVVADLAHHIEHWPVAVTVADPAEPDCPIVIANVAFGDMTGYRPSEITGQNCRFLQGSGTDQADVRDLGQAVKAELPTQTCLLNYRKSGELFHNFLTVYPLDLTGGRRLLLGCQFVFQIGVAPAILTDHSARLSDLIGKTDGIVPNERAALMINSAKAQSGAVAARLMRYVAAQSRASA